MKDEILKLWAKTSPNSDEPDAFHPLICHLIDVATVTKIIWNKILPKATKQRIARAFGETSIDKTTLDKIGRLVAFIAGLHDLGKCSPPFALRGKYIESDLIKLENRLAEQTDKTSDYAIKLHKKIQTIKLLKIYDSPELKIQGLPRKAFEAPHGYITAVELPQILENIYKFPKGLTETLSILIGGHHGVFPSTDKLNSLTTEDCIGTNSWKELRIEIVKSLGTLLRIEDIQLNQTIKFGNEKIRTFNGTIMIFAGLVSVADWIGSDTDYFECAAKFDDKNVTFNYDDLDVYFKFSKNQAEKALNELGWLNWAEYKTPKKFDELFSFKPRGSQIEAIKIAEELKTIGIFVIEEPTGKGKTETAMFIADTLNANLKQRGIYFALPTQATSNQMFGRVGEFLERRFEKGIVQTQLIHGHSSLSAEFKTLKQSYKNIRGIYEECVGDECVPHVVAAEWFTARKRGLLAPFGVGTVDQALMAVLQTKHLFVRLFGLAHKTVIIDEIHAYDAYMSTLLELLLEWLAALGSPVILLSATLPIKRRNDLVKAYLRGLGIEKSEIVGKDEYPRITYATDSTIKVRHIEPSEENENKPMLFIEKVDDYTENTDENFIKKLKAKLKEKDSDEPCGCIAIICNTVQRSQDIYNSLKIDESELFKGDSDDGMPKLDLLHSQFRFINRNKIEDRVRIRFGKKGEKIKITENDKEKEVKRPDFAVLVSTQIIEQSLDLDFDLMISDLAPVDLLLQRAGRIQRHDRDSDKIEEAEKRPKIYQKNPILWIINPETDETGLLKPDRKGLPDFGKAGIVYDKHILLRTWLALNKEENTEIKIPGEIEILIKTVYDESEECPNQNYLSFWNESEVKMNDKKKLKKDRANFFSIMETDEPDLFAVRLLHLDEDNPPEKHKDLRAVTRDSDIPSVSVIILKHDELPELDLESKPNKKITEYLLRREAKISKFGLTDKIIDSKQLKPEGWKKSQYLRHYRLLRLDVNNEFREIDKYIISLDESLGIIIDEENKNG